MLNCNYFIIEEALQFSLITKFSRFEIRAINFTKIDNEFDVTNTKIGRLIVEGLLRGLEGKDAFGTKFPLIERHYPSVFLGNDYLIVFDHSEIYI